MQNSYFGRVTPGMTVFDIAGNKVGDIARVYRYQASRSNAEEGTPRTAQDDVIEVKTGWFGMGKHFYIPTSAIDDGLEESVFLSKPKEELEHLGWTVKPPELDDLD